MVHHIDTCTWFPRRMGLGAPAVTRLNAVTIPDRYRLPNMQSLNDRMAGCTVFFEN